MPVSDDFDVEATISIVEQNPVKFKITGPEMSERKGFIAQTKLISKVCLTR